MKIKQLLITGIIPVLAAGSILAGCSASQNQTASNGAQEGATVAENYDSAEKDDKTYDLVDYVLSGKPLIEIWDDYHRKNDYLFINFMIKDNKLYEVGKRINITLGDYSNMTDEELFDFVLNNLETKPEPKQFVIGVSSDKTGNNLGKIVFFFKDPQRNEGYVSYEGYAYYPIYDIESFTGDSFVIYDSEFVKIGRSTDKYYYRFNKPIKNYGTLEDYKNMDGILYDATVDDVKAALGI